MDHLQRAIERRLEAAAASHSSHALRRSRLPFASWQCCRVAPRNPRAHLRLPCVRTAAAGLTTASPSEGHVVLLTPQRCLHTRAEGPAAGSLLAEWLAKRNAAPVPAWAAHVSAQRAMGASTIAATPSTSGSAVETHQGSEPDQKAVARRTRAPSSITTITTTSTQQREPRAAARPTMISSSSESVPPLFVAPSAHAAGLRTTVTTTAAVGDGSYVPLLYREGVLPPGSRVCLPQLPLCMRGTPSHTTESQQQQQQQESVHETFFDIAEPSSLTAIDAVSTDPQQELFSSPSLSASPSPASSTVAPARRSRTLILDPVQWLAQDVDAPLMEDELLQSHITPSAFAGMAALYARWEAQGDADTVSTDIATLASHLETASTQPSEEVHQQQQQHETFDVAEASAAETTPTVTLTEVEAPSSSAHGASVDDLMVATDAAMAGSSSLAEGSPLRAEDASDGATASPRQPVRTAVRRRTAEPMLATIDGAGGSSSAPESSPSSSSLMVYNIFTGRVAQSTSAGIHALALMGIAVNAETRQLCVSNPDAVHLLAQELRGGRISWPKCWARGVVFRQAQSILASDAVIDPVSRLQALVEAQYVRVQRRQQDRGGVVAAPHTGDAADSGGSGETPGDSAALSVPSQSSSNSSLSIGGASRASELLTLADLNEEQQRVVDFVKQGYNTYIGGGAGTGKSVLLRVLRQELLKEGLTVAMTGTTGMAGWHIGGCTLHHCFGINIFGEFTRRKELAAYDVLVIDEVSMLSRQLFESLEYQLRRANGVDLPFGGVQVILCGDFLQLGAIAAQPIVNSPVFRSHFAMLKLKTVIRQDQHKLFSRQLDVLRRGKIPEGLQNTVQFLTAEEVVLAKEEERARSQTQLQQLRQVLDKTSSDVNSGAGTESALLQQVSEKEASLRHAAEVESTFTDTPSDTSDIAKVPYVADAVNLLPTNAQVEVRNQLELMKLQGDAVSFPALIMPPTTLGTWSPTCLLRITDRTGWAAAQEADVAKGRDGGSQGEGGVGRRGSPGRGAAAAFQKRLFAEVEQFLASFFIATPRGSSSSSSSPEEEDVNGMRLQRAATAWLSSLMTGSRNIVLYRLFTDAFVLRVRIPAEVSEMDAQAFVAHIGRIDDALFGKKPDLGVRVREWLPTAEGLHTEEDEAILAHYAARSPMSRGVQLKLGARVMLRTNLSPQHVNGSLGTVVGFRTLSMHDLPRYLISSPEREEAVQAYADFLRIEHGMEEAVVPEVDFGDGHVEAVPPVAFYVGGHANTHQYSAGIVALPLTLAYAFTVHKVQGLTLVGRVHLELSRMWPCEHLLYVAMSRVRNPEQLSVSSFSPRLVQASPECVLFDDSVPSVDDVVVLASFVQATWRRSPSRRKRVVRRKQLEAAQRKKKQQEQQLRGLEAGDGLVKKRSSRAETELEIKRIQDQLLAAEGKS